MTTCIRFRQLEVGKISEKQEKAKKKKDKEKEKEKRKKTKGETKKAKGAEKTVKPESLTEARVHQKAKNKKKMRNAFCN